MSAGKIVNLLRGSVEVEVTGDFPERFLNLCAQKGTAFWAVEWPDSRTLRLTVAWWDRKGLEELAERCGCTVAEGRRRGMPHFLLRFRRRYALLAGLAAALAAVCFLSRFVLVIEVEGNQRVSGPVILSELRHQGLRPGVYGPGLDLRDISTRAMLGLEELSWMTVNLHGIRAQVVVREKLPQPKVVDDTVYGDIVAAAPGIVTRLEAWSGDAMVSEGDTVLPGDVLIRGMVELEPPPYSTEPPGWLPVRAMGEAEGRTWRVLSAAIPLTAQVKALSGEEVRVWSVTALDRRVKISQNSGISSEKYDKISRTWSLRLPGGTVLPFSLRRETLRPYATVTREVDLEAARTMLEGVLLSRLEELLGEKGEAVSHSFSAQSGGGLLTVTLTAECRESLGRFVPAE